MDPRPEWKKLSLPVLFIVGDRDTQVPAAPMIKALKDAVSKADLLTVEERPGLNHMFQHAQTGLPAEYATIDETFDPESIDILTRWLKKQAGVP